MLHDGEARAERRCVDCGGAFMSRGPQNRMCPKCKASRKRKRTGEIATRNPRALKTRHGSDSFSSPNSQDDAAKAEEDGRG